MRVLGFTLFIIGFAWLCVSTVSLPAIITAVTSDSLEVTSRRETFTRQEVFDLLVAQGKGFRRHIPWIFTPALLMFFGGSLVSRPRHLKRDNAASHDKCQ
jgi:hypothetical protein